ncbi:MAG: aminotransferase class I/II-fold pyridoxal phosphate-dependent enzyme [Peptococcales bacterium]|jgi:arginine/lysine/ornithine decarboxylase
MSKTPIINSIHKHLSKRPYSTHTPGHKGGQIIPTALREKWPQEMWQYDLTEIDGLDNLHDPSGCIKDAQKLTAQLYNAQASYFLVNGTSVGIQAAIMALAYNSPIFVPRNVHKSIYNGLILANAEPIYLPVTYDETLGCPLGIEPEDLELWIKKYPQCKTIILTHPTYQGISYKFQEVISVAHANNLQIIVDEAHGSHLAFHPDLPLAALSLGAHIVIQSWHKTLPVLTQASVLHIGHNYSGPSITQFLNMLQTTSPSYLLLASLDACQAFLAEYKIEQIAETINNIESLKKKVASLRNLSIYSQKNNCQFDPYKICLTSNKTSGYHLAELLQKRYDIYIELAEERYCLILLGIINSQDFIQKLLRVLIDIDKSLEELPVFSFTKEKNPQIIPKTVVRLQEAFFRPKEKLDIDKALGKVAGDFLIKYPPGVPLLVPGEIIDQRIIAILKKDIEKFKIEDGIFVLNE